MNIEIANRLVELRKKNGYSQEDVAEKIGVSRQAVSKWERAESSPDTDNLIALSRLYQVSLDEMLHTEEASSPQKMAAGPADAGESADGKHGTSSFPFPAVAAGLFLLIGFLSGHWEYAWLVLLAIPVYYWISETAHRKKSGIGGE